MDCATKNNHLPYPKAKATPVRKNRQPWYIFEESYWYTLTGFFVNVNRRLWNKSFQNKHQRIFIEHQ